MASESESSDEDMGYGLFDDFEESPRAALSPPGASLKAAVAPIAAKQIIEEAEGRSKIIMKVCDFTIYSEMNSNKLF